MQHALARHAALEAARAKTTAFATLHATATAYGCKDAHHGFNEFLSRMDAIIAFASDAGQPDPSQPTPQEIAYFEAIERAALANAKQPKA